MLRDKLSLVPTNPGCYLMKDKDGIIIYVGKAKNLKNRVSSYFNSAHTGKTQKLVREIADFEYIITNTEVESLVLELNLIKKYDPKYNILLKDDKSYPYIGITNEKVPRLLVIRNIRRRKKENYKVFGPYPNVTAARNTVNLLNRMYPLRKCMTYNKKPCLYYHIGECLGYCNNLVSKEKIDDMVTDIIRFLKGDHSLVTKKIKDQIEAYSERLEFEKCKELKELLDYIEVVLNRQKVNLNDGVDRDVFGYSIGHEHISIQVFFLRGGNLVERKSDILPFMASFEEELTRYIVNFYDQHEKPRELLVPEGIDTSLLEEVLQCKVSIPLRGEKKKLLDLAHANAKMSLEKELELQIKSEEERNHTLEELCQLLHLSSVKRIEIFDNSNLFGTFSVSGMVVFTNGMPDKKEYRKYKIVGEFKDDYHIMKEVIYRRYYRVLIEKLEKPNLIIVDGGIIQMNACLDVLKELGLELPVVGLKKDNHHRTAELLYQGTILPIDKYSALFRLLTRMQDEVHRYTIHYHKEIRSKGSLESILDEIPGIGPKRRKQLLKKYKTIIALKGLDLISLEEILPHDVAVRLQEYLKDT